MAPQREWFEKDYYKILGIAEEASQKEVTRAYRKLARKLHPDANPDDSQAEERFKEISAAYDVVGDPDKRKEYDELRRLGPLGGGIPGGGTGFRFEDFGGLGDFGDLLGGLFGGRAQPRSRGRASAVRGRDLEAELHLNFEQAVFGATTEVHVTSEVACPTCSGSGAQPGTTPVSCHACGGTGM